MRKACSRRGESNISKESIHEESFSKELLAPGVEFSAANRVCQ